MATSPATDVHSPMHLDSILLAEELLDLAERAQAYTNAAGVAIALRRGQDLVVRTSTGAAPEVGGIIPLSDAFIADCLRSRRPLCCRDSESDNRVGPVFRAMKTRSLIAIPICEHRDAKGVMIVIAPLPNAFQPTHTAILLTLSDIIASKLAARDAMPVVDAALPNFADLPSVALPEASPAMVASPVPAAKAAAAAASASSARPAFMPAPAAMPAPVEPPAVPPAPVMPASNPAAHAVPFREVAKPVPNEPATTSPAASMVPSALLREAAMPLPVEKPEGAPDPGLLSPSEDPTRFKPVRPIASSNTLSARPDFMSITLKPVPPRTVTPAPPVADVRPPAADSKPAFAEFRPMISEAKHATGDAKPAIIDAKPAITDAKPAIAWEAPDLKTSKRPMAIVAAVAAALVLVAGLWIYGSATKEVSAPTARAVPAPATAALPPATPVSMSMTVKAEDTAAKPTSAKPEQPKAANTEAVAFEPKHPAASKVIEIAAAKPRPEPEAEVQAPKLALTSNDSVVNSLSKLPVAVPARPKSELIPATLTSRVAPTFPAIARHMGIYGAVVMSVTISPSGAVSDVRVLSGESQLRDAAINAVKQWRYKPAMLNGQPTESTAEVQVNFTR
jgi:protein TonB